MAGFGRQMSPLDVLRLPGRTYIQTQSVCNYVQSQDYGHLFTPRVRLLVFSTSLTKVSLRAVSNS